MMFQEDMATTKIAVTVDKETLREVDRWVKSGRFPSRSRAIQVALAEMIARRKRSRLANELAKLNLEEEKALAEEQFAGELAWPECGGAKFTGRT
jgi:Arc/MetJ-type ribon-helix-helix transcriptional regulator